MYIIYNMPAKIFMKLSNGNRPHQMPTVINTSSLSPASVAPTNRVTSLNSPIIGRIHNVKAGCGSCGR